MDEHVRIGRDGGRAAVELDAAAGGARDHAGTGELAAHDRNRGVAAAAGYGFEVVLNPRSV